MPLVDTLAVRTRSALSFTVITILVTAGYLSVRHAAADDGASVGGRAVGAAAASFAWDAEPDTAGSEGSSVELLAYSAYSAYRTSLPAAEIVLKSINAVRRHVGLPALRANLGLRQSAKLHDLAMGYTNTMSHQLAAESALGRRISTQHVPWTTAGENVGWTSSISYRGAVSINTMMVDETAPNDGHRRNILSRSFNSVGIAVLVDDVHHRLWLTEDFART